jgi:Fe-S cluster biosynthesis and repair protein YggX
MAAAVHCVRCGRTEAPALARMPVPGKFGQEIREKVCADCWADWQRVEVMVINELRLNFMDPGAQQTLNQHMREFLFTPQAGNTGLEARAHEEH